VRFFAGSSSFAAYGSALRDIVAGIREADVWVNGPVVARCEEALARYVGARHVVMVNSGSDALVMMLQAAGIGPGDEVIVPAYTFFATVSSVLHVGARPVIVDILPDSYTMDPDAAARAVTDRTRAVLPVHIFAQLADMDRFGELADERGLLLLEDSAQGIGMRWRGRHAGTVGRAGVLSFFPSKTLGAFGDAGAVVTNDDTIGAAVRAARDGTSHAGPNRVTFRSRCDELQAAVLLTRLERLDQDIARRAELAAAYTERLAELPEVVPPAPDRTGGSQDAVWYVYLARFADRDAVAAHLRAHDVPTEIYYPCPLSAQPCLTPYLSSPQPVPVADAASREVLALPLYPDLSDEDVEHVCALVRSHYTKEAAGVGLR
jgi:UDP-2-acetamido-2-deoxy-ribo-hexuluronate aminotransferase